MEIIDMFLFIEAKLVVSLGVIHIDFNIVVAMFLYELQKYNFFVCLSFLFIINIFLDQLYKYELSSRTRNFERKSSQ